MRGDSDATEGYVVPAPLVTPVVIAKQYEHPFKHNTDLQNDDMLLVEYRPPYLWYIKPSVMVL